jgi:hypothetical protein
VNCLDLDQTDLLHGLEREQALSTPPNAKSDPHITAHIERLIRALLSGR